MTITSPAVLISSAAGIATAALRQSARVISSAVPMSVLSEPLYAVSIEQIRSIAVIEIRPLSGEPRFSAAIFPISAKTESKDKSDRSDASALSAPSESICAFASSERLSYIPDISQLISSARTEKAETQTAMIKTGIIINFFMNMIIIL